MANFIFYLAVKFRFNHIFFSTKISLAVFLHQGACTKCIIIASVLNNI